MQNIINYQTCVFGDYLTLEPTLERMNSLANIPSELGITLLPTTVNIINLNAPFPQEGTILSKGIQRINMVDTTQKWGITILPERIDVNFQQQNGDREKMLFNPGDYAFDKVKNERVQILSVSDVWGFVSYKVHCPADDDHVHPNAE